MKIYTSLPVAIIIIIHNVCGGVVVEVEQGKLLGEEKTLVTNDGTYYSFKGIPYAQAPVGSLRFKDPQPPLTWEGVRNATEHGSVCPQVDIFTGTYIPGNEDCLFLNAYTPNITESVPGLPVMVFIHGGGYQCGSGNSDSYGPDLLIRKNVVVVTINYRLGVLGFSCMHTKEVPGNAGLKDQVAALKWVNKNINKFGGDPKNVTIFGQSAGAGSVGYHTISPMSKGLFKRAISMSGSPINGWSIAFRPVERFAILGKILGCDSYNKTILLTCLQNVTSETIVQAKPTVLTSEEYNNIAIKMYLHVPVIEEDNGQEMFISKDPTELLNSGNVNAVDYMSGYTDREGIILIPAIESTFLSLYNRYPEMLCPHKIMIKSDAETIMNVSSRVHDRFFGNQSINIDTITQMVDYISNTTIEYELQRFFKAYPNPGNNTRYFYKFACYSKRNVNGTEGAKYGIYGAGHVEDLLYLFNPEALNFTLEANTTEYKMVDLVTTTFSNFAKYGNPTPDVSLGVTWPQYDNTTLAYAEINSTLTIYNAPDAADMLFWDSILSYAGIDS